MQLNQVTIPVRDINASIAFYKKLGLRLIVHTNDYYARFECPQSQDHEQPATFSIHKVELLPSDAGVWVYFEVPDVDTKVEELVGQGLKIVEAAEDKKWLWREAKLADLDGNQIIIYHAGKNRRYPPWRKTNV